MTTTTNPETAAILAAIAKEHLLIPTLAARNRDRLDFHDCGVANLRAALQAAYDAGRRHRTRRARPVAEEVHGELVFTQKPTGECGDWATGRIGAFSFQAKVYPEHAKVANYEIGRSRISKLELRRLDNDAVAYAWDRGLDTPAIDAAAQAAVDALAAQLADLCFGSTLAN
jgi:hypothetical protein